MQLGIYWFLLILMSMIMVLMTILTNAKADLYTSIADLDLMIDAQKQLPDLMDLCIDKVEKKLDTIRMLVGQHKNWSTDLTANRQQIITNPLSAFLLIKNLIAEWKLVRELLAENFNEGIMSNNSDIDLTEHLKYPTIEDLHGAAQAIIRLQDTYRLDVKDLVDGRIMHTKTEPLTANDCFEIGRVAYIMEDFYHTVIWMTEAKNRLHHENLKTVSLAKILEYLSFSLFKQGNLKRALVYTEQLYRIDPSHPHAKTNINWYESQLEADGVNVVDMRRNLPPLINERDVDDLGNSERAIYEALCRNEISVSTKEQSQVYCYFKMDRPYLRLSPFKVEIIRIRPLIVLFHDVISDNEILHLQMLATPKLRRATVQNAKTGELETATYRISKSAWLKHHEHEVVTSLNKRMDLMTNLEQETAEDIQVANYGIGGHYDPHFDFARKEEPRAFEVLGTGNRMATLLFYMTEPEIGGATVFTELRLTVMPKKHSALFWYNLLRSGDGDMRTRHAACPVLIGTKWVANKWIHERAQEFRRPCACDRTHQEQYVGDLGGREPRHIYNI